MRSWLAVLRQDSERRIGPVILGKVPETRGTVSRTHTAQVAEVKEKK